MTLGLYCRCEGDSAVLGCLCIRATDEVTAYARLLTAEYTKCSPNAPLAANVASRSPLGEAPSSLSSRCSLTTSAVCFSSVECTGRQLSQSFRFSHAALQHVRYQQGTPEASATSREQASIRTASRKWAGSTEEEGLHHT